jgi:hypothetical protein
MTAILDTSFLFALTDLSDLNHDKVLSVAQTINEPLVLPTVVLPEVCYLIASRLGHRVMRQFLSNLADNNIQLESLTPDDLKRVGIAELGYDSPSPRQILRLWLPSPKLGRGAGGEGKVYASYPNSATPKIESKRVPAGFKMQPVSPSLPDITSYRFELGLLLP